MVDTSASMTGRVVLGRYRVVAPLARGGMGIVYLGRLEGAAGFAKPVVIKTVIPEQSDARAVPLFVREARILSNLEHPAIVGVLDFGESRGEYVMVLEYVHGFHLGAWARFVSAVRGPLPISHGVEVMLPILDALHFAHSLKRPDGTPLGIVHRDISPANILIDNQGHVKLHDFGIARFADDEFKTQDGTFRGTLSYSAPETLQGTPATPQSDLYGAAVVLYQVLAGSNPFKGQTPSETLNRVLKHVPESLHEVRPEVSEELARVIARALAKEPTDRFANVEDFATALRAARTWSEHDAVLELTRSIQADFDGEEMPEHLGVEPLASRDQAWREAVGARTRLSSSPPRESLTIKASTLASLGAETESALRAPLVPAVSAEAVVASSATKPARRAPLAWFGGALGLAVLGGGAYFVVNRAPSPGAPQFLLIEKQAAADSASASGVPTSTVPGELSAAPADSGKAPAPKGTVSAAASAAHAKEAMGTTLTGAFQRQQGRVTACFKNNPATGAGEPQLSIHFKVDGSGAVQAADLSPSSVVGTPLGGCILSVARSTHFPATGEPVNFSIPITAVRH